MAGQVQMSFFIITTEQIQIKVVNETAESATLMSSCNQNISRAYTLESENSSQQEMREINLQCGDQMAVTGLLPATVYVLFQRLGSGMRLCRVETFMTSAPSKKNP